jgi:5'(3')-deoxyribonucleotidase
MIFIDCDGVLSNTVGRILKAVNASRKAPPYATEEDITNFDFRKCHALTHEEQELCYALLRSQGFAKELSAYEGAEAFLVGLRGISRVVCLTSPMHGAPDWAYCRVGWLAARGFSPRDIVQCEDKALLCAAITDVLIDDAVHNIAEWPAMRVLIDRPWNRAYDGARYNYRTALGHIRDMARFSPDIRRRGC